jgi:hypothetical protein
MAFKSFVVEMPLQQVAALLDAGLSPKRFHHHDRQGGVNWRVSIAPDRRQTTVLLDESVDDSVISYLLLKQ